ncbi:MAG: hypothetical protein BMS9Abin19_0616 [Gammaproteobacteria bacterium]|nr:MAG: hypothetical protein BMS9Abin19_0616 [Gammaproteobacteria bacterium]
MVFNKSGYYFIVLLFLAIIGFWESYFSKLFGEIDSYKHFHAITMLLWIGMLITQAFLIRFKKWSLHKFIGRFSYGLVPVLIISLVLLAHSQITIHDFGITYSRLYILFLQLSLLAIFMTAYGLAIFYRKSPNQHARYMICTSLTLIDPAVARIPLDLPPLPFSYQVLTFGITDLILLTLIIMERNRTNGREVFPVMLGIFVVFQGLNLTWTDSAVWDNFSLWFARLPLS